MEELEHNPKHKYYNKYNNKKQPNRIEIPLISFGLMKTFSFFHIETNKNSHNPCVCNQMIFF